MNKTLAIAAATLALASTTLVSVAEAGGVRLQFGFPLGSFVARECGSCGNSSSHSHRHHHDYGAARRAAARAEAIAEARREKAAEARREAIAEARREKAAEARREAVAEARRERQAEERREARLAKQKEEKKAEEVAAVEATDNAPDEAPLPVRPDPQLMSDVTIGEPKVVIGKASGPVEGEVKVSKVETAPVATAPATAPAKVAEPRKPIDCKKFVPSAGLTITVPCQ